MKKLQITLLLMMLVLSGWAQNISVESFRCLPDDPLATSAEGKRIDQNGSVAALIKIKTEETGLNFEGGALGIVDARQLEGEVWVWVPRSARKITVKHPKLGILRDYRYPVEIKEGTTYEMVLKIEKVVIEQEEETVEQFVSFIIFPPNAVLEVNDEVWTLASNGSVSRLVEFGTYTYKVSAENYHSDAGRIKVDDPKKPVVVTVNLRPNFSNVTLMVDADAEIWVDGELKGTRTWTGDLNVGSYQIECRQAHHETTTMQKTITDQMGGNVIKLKAPQPILGSLQVDSDPSQAMVFIDGKALGLTPLHVDGILTGQHLLKVEKEGFVDFKKSIEINRTDCLKTHITLNKQTYPIGAVNGVFSVSSNKKVYFSKGNLQYQASTGTWRFAENQWDAVGGAADDDDTFMGNMPGNSNSDISPIYAGWIDLFSWGTSGWDNGNLYYQPYSNTGVVDYMGNDSINDKIGYGYGPTDGTNYNYDLTGPYANSDWGIYNAIVNGGNKAGLWRTLTKDEWIYLLDTRNTKTGMRFVKAKVNDMNGIILLPDNWDASNYVFSNSTDTFDSNIINVSDWIILENAGAVFLPTAGYRLQGKRIETAVYDFGSTGVYYSSTRDDAFWAHCMKFSDDDISSKYGFHVRVGCSIRLVQPCK